MKPITCRAGPTRIVLLSHFLQISISLAAAVLTEMQAATAAAGATPPMSMQLDGSSRRGAAWPRRPPSSPSCPRRRRTRRCRSVTTRDPWYLLPVLALVYMSVVGISVVFTFKKTLVVATSCLPKCSYFLM